MLFIGDIHGKVGDYLDLLARFDEPSVQVGDFGMGFLGPYNMGRAAEAHAAGHRFIRGNHDDPALCRASDGWIEDGHAEGDMMFVGGAWSIDCGRRLAYEDRYGVKTWWPDEELSVPELTRMHALYVYRKPKIMVTHDCPTSVAKELFLSNGRKQYITNTAEAFEAMFRDHQPDVWIFGHWHESVRRKIGSTEFICLNELEPFMMEV